MKNESLTRSQLYRLVASRQTNLSVSDVELGVRKIISTIMDSLASGKPVKLRDFGTFGLRFRKQYTARNPRTGETVTVAGHYISHFRAGEQLRAQVAEDRR